jgi:hypothetical protein
MQQILETYPSEFMYVLFLGIVLGIILMMIYEYGKIYFKKTV